MKATDISTYPEQGNGTRPQVNGGTMLVSARVVGITPLLMNAMTAGELLKIRAKEKAPKNAVRPSPREEAEQGLHVLTDGRPHIPVTMLWSCLIGAGQFIRLDGKRQVSTAQSTVLPGLITLDSRTLPLIDPTSGATATWEVDIQQGRNPNGGEAVAVVRPRFDAWAFEVELSVDQREVSVSTVRDLFDVAGRRRGLGDFRPQRKGIFGQFRVDVWRMQEP